MNLKSKLPLIATIGIAFLLRIYGITWDEGMHLHPDERMLIMVADRIRFFSQLNPDFFNYGSLPVYLLKGTSVMASILSGTRWDTYDGMLPVGRIISAFIDTYTVILIYKICLALTKVKKVAIGSAFIYAISFFPIQNAHFFIVDPLLTFFVTGTLYQLLKYCKKQSLTIIILIALFSAGAITTKFTGILLIPIIVSTFTIRTWFTQSSVLPKLIELFKTGAIYSVTFLLACFIAMPFGFLKHHQFIKEISLQLKMNSDPFIFPYTLQYVGTLPYWYHIENILKWGLGPFISILSTLGIFLFVKTMRTRSKRSIILSVVLIGYALLHFLFIGKSAVKFMRYMLPLYPFAAISAGYGLYKLNEMVIGKKQTPIGSVLAQLLVLGSVFWTIMFISIYSRVHTRIEASDWIYKNIPSGATLAVEHWDDRLPLPLPNRLTDNNQMSPRYTFQELELYNPDTPEKWQKINIQLYQSDYIIIASNRLYVPLMRLIDCNNVPKHRCYPITSQYYQDLFAEKGDFIKVAEFNSYPGINLGNYRLQINDQSADESFTVYDHPKILIFKNRSRG